MHFANMVTHLNEDAVSVIKGRTLKIFTPKSQSHRSMDRKEFAASKDAVLDVIAKLIGVTVEELSKNAGQAA